MTQPLFIVLEGVDGCGKSTQARLLAGWLEARGVAVLLVREPGGTALGEQLRAALLEGEDVHARTELLLMLAARSALVEERIRPALAEGRVVLADRFTLSSLAYQGYGRGLPLGDVRRLNDFATGGLRPDLTLVLRVPEAVARRRRGGGPGGEDRIERAGTDFAHRVGEAYALLAEREEGIVVVDAQGTPEAVHGAIVAVLEARFPGTFSSPAG
ncbi:MAG TPA: dTMP kinase [Longimicrobiales bacterium]|nr:dTMP kinase [Longimicrobiales bacterium]